MSQDSDKMKAIVAFKKKLEKKIEELDSEMKELQSTLETVNSILLDKGFKRGDIKEIQSVTKETVSPKEVIEKVSEKPTARSQSTSESESVIPLRTLDDEPLAIIYVDKQSLHVLPDERKNFSIDTPPFSHFLIERVLTKMQEKDNELVRMGQLTPEKMFAYNIVHEGDLIREIIIRNVDEERIRELKSSIRWTLEKMYEKTKR
jgi:hypothetical protein